MSSISEFVHELVLCLQTVNTLNQEAWIHDMFVNVLADPNLSVHYLPASSSLKKAALEEGRAFNPTAIKLRNKLSAENFSRWLTEFNIAANVLDSFVINYLIPNNLISEKNDVSNSDKIATAFVDIINSYAFPNRRNSLTAPILTYDKYIGIIKDSLAVSRYESVLLTLPDLDFAWQDMCHDEAKHFLHKKKNEIDNTENGLLDVIVETNNRQKFVKKVEASIYQFYAYRSWLYVRQMIKFILRNHDENPSEENVYNSVYSVLSALERNPMLPDHGDFVECLNSFPNEYHRIIGSREEIVDNLLALFVELSSQVILLNMNVQMHKNFKLVSAHNEIIPPKESFVQWMENEIIRNNLVFKDENRKLLYEFLFLYNKVNHESAKYKSVVAEYFYEDFFSFVNTKTIQDKYLSVADKQLYDGIVNLYKMFYYEMKYSIYRGYDENTIDEPNGFMQCDLLDRKISRDFLKLAFPNFNETSFNSNAILKFSHITPLLTDEEFILRPANGNDIDNIIALNNPMPPFRRAIYIPSNEKEIRSAVDKHMAWIIEQEAQDGTRHLACAAIILKYEFDISKESIFLGFNSDSLNNNFAEEYYQKVQRSFNFVDFDSVLTYSGRGIISTNDTFSSQSYRGYGFQRLMMVLCEELAVSIYNADYIVGAVSPFNRFSRRNFALQGFRSRGVVMYELDEGMVESPYNKFIEGKSDIKPTKFQTDEWMTIVDKEIYKDPEENLKRLGLDQNDYDDYWEDKKVPRIFMLLPLK